MAGKHRHSGRHRMRFAHYVVAFAAFFAACLIAPSGPADASGAAVMVEDHLGGRNDVLLRRSIKFVDRFTMSHMVLGTCVSGKRCIVVEIDNSLPLGAGVTSQTSGREGRSDALIRLHINKQYGDKQIRLLMEHELGHAFGLPHAGGCNIMMPVLNCKTWHGITLPREAFNNTQRRVLGRY